MDKIISMLGRLFNVYQDCEKLVIMDGKILDKQPAISKSNFTNMIRRVYSVCEGEKQPDTESKCNKHIVMPRIFHFEDESGKQYDLMNDFKITIDSTGKLNFTVDIIGEPHGIRVIPKYGA